MTVYVDDSQIPATVHNGHAWRTSRWSHLFADTADELHAFAARLGLHRFYFQPGTPRGDGSPSPLWHYDATEPKRWQAIKLGAQGVTWREAVTIMNARNASSQARPITAKTTRAAQGARHSWKHHGKHRKWCQACGIQALARPHPYERRWYQEYTTSGGRRFTADRVPPCEPAALPAEPARPTARERLAREADHAVGRAYQAGDLATAARLIADARVLDPGRGCLWAQREAALTRRVRAAPDAGLPLGQVIASRLAAAGYTGDSPEVARIRAHNAACARAGLPSAHPARLSAAPRGAPEREPDA